MQLSSDFLTLFQEFSDTYQKDGAPSLIWYSDANYKDLDNFLQSLNIIFQKHTECFDDIDILPYLNDIVIKYGAKNRKLLHYWLEFTNKYYENIRFDIAIQYVCPGKTESDFNGLFSGLKTALDDAKHLLAQQRKSQKISIQRISKQAQEGKDRARQILDILPAEIEQSPDMQERHIATTHTSLPTSHTLPGLTLPDPNLNAASLPKSGNPLTISLKMGTDENAVYDKFFTLFQDFVAKYTKSSNSWVRSMVTDKDYDALCTFLKSLLTATQEYAQFLYDLDIIRYLNDVVIRYGSKNPGLLNIWLDFTDTYYLKVSPADIRHNIYLPTSNTTNNLGSTIETLKTELLEIQQTIMREKKQHDETIQRLTQQILEVKNHVLSICSLLNPIITETSPQLAINLTATPPPPPPPPPTLISVSKSIDASEIQNKPLHVASINASALLKNSIFDKPKGNALSLSEIIAMKKKLRATQPRTAPIQAENILTALHDKLAQIYNANKQEEEKEETENNDFS